MIFQKRKDGLIEAIIAWKSYIVVGYGSSEEKAALNAYRAICNSILD
jgi:hypothetical protein